MKKLSIISLALISAAFLSCTKEIGLNSTPAEQEGTQVTLLVNNAAVVCDEDSKTAYTPGKGIKLEGTEKMAMYYVPAGATALAATISVANPTTTAGTYSFTVPSGAEKASWYAVMPYSRSLVSKNSAGSSMTLRVGPVQYPKANSFDPQADFLLAEAFDLDVTAGAQTAEIKNFKRLFAPLRIRVTGLPEGEKIYAFTIESSQTADKYGALNGFYYVSFSKDFASAKVSAIDVNSEGNAMSAVYDGGLSAVSGSWPVWLVVGPTTLKAASTLTFTVSTGTKTYTKTVTLSSDLVLKVYSNAINDMSVDMSKGATSKESSTAIFLNSKNNGWTIANSKYYIEADSVLPSGALCFVNAAGSFTFPEIPGKEIVGARVFTHPSNRYNSTAVVTLTVDGKDTYNFNLSKTAAAGNGTPVKGGAVDISLPAGKTSLAGLQVTVGSNQQHIISAVTLYLEDGSVDYNDYYAQYLAGQDITVGDITVNLTNYPAANTKLVKAYEFTNANYLVTQGSTYGDVVFLDYDETDGKEDTYQITYNIKPENKIIIGRYKNHQPKFTFSGTSTIYPTKANFALKNVRFESANYSISTSYSTEPLTLNIEDCTLITTSDFSFVQANGTIANNFESINVVNSIVRCNKSVLAQTSAISVGSSYSVFTKLALKNTVFTAPATTAGYGTFYLRTSGTAGYYTPNLDINIDHCTFHNFNSTGLGILPIMSAKSLIFDNNVIGVALGKGCMFVQVGNAALDPKISGSVSGNNAYSSTANAWAVEYSSKYLTNSGLTVSGNTCKASDDPFDTTIDVANLYIPINTTKVTNGAGASYSTKLWNTWTK